MSHEWFGGLLIGVGFVAVFAAFIRQVARSAYFWGAAKINGWDHHEKFMR